MSNNLYYLLAILVMYAVTYSLRSFAFVAFSQKQPPAIIVYIGKYISPAIIAALIVYCFKDTSFAAPRYGLPELIATVICVGLHLWKHNPLISIICSTIVYMLLLQKVCV